MYLCRYMSESVIDVYAIYLNDLAQACGEEEAIYDTHYFNELDMISRRPGQCWAAHKSTVHEKWCMAMNRFAWLRSKLCNAGTHCHGYMDSACGTLHGHERCYLYAGIHVIDANGHKQATPELIADVRVPESTMTRGVISTHDRFLGWVELLPLGLMH